MPGTKNSLEENTLKSWVGEDFWLRPWSADSKAKVGRWDFIYKSENSEVKGIDQ